MKPAAGHYMLKRWDGFTRFLDDGSVWLSNNAAERSLRGIALGRISWPLAGSNRGGQRAATMPSLIVTAKLNDIDPQAWLGDVLARIAEHPSSKLDELLPWERKEGTALTLGGLIRLWPTPERYSEAGRPDDQFGAQGGRIVSTPLDATSARSQMGGPSFDLRHRLLRAVWTVCWGALASWTPPPLHGWRRMLLRLFGARIAPTAHVYGSARIWYPPNLEMAAYACLGPRVNCYCMAPITLGPYALASQGAFLCAGTHNVDSPNFQLLVKPIRIGASAWIAAEAFVGPGVTVGDGAVLGARGVLFRDLPAGQIAAGNPALILRKRTTNENEIQGQGD